MDFHVIAIVVVEDLNAGGHVTYGIVANVHDPTAGGLGFD